MKKTLLSIIVTFTLLSGFSQAFDQADGTLNLQIMPGYAYDPGSNSYNTSKTVLPALMVSYDFGVHELISVAPYAYFQHSSYSYDYNNWNNGNWGSNHYKSEVKYNNLGFGARGLFHFGNMINGLNVEKLDLYGGLALGFATRFKSEERDYYNNIYTDETVKSNSFDFEYDVFAGARWYFSEAFAVNAEVGFGTSIAKIGVTFKM